MMTNLFSSFDPTSNIFNIPMNWLSTLLGMLILPSSYWLIPNRSSLMWNLLINKLYNEFKTLLVGNKNMGSSFMFISVFSIILFNNFLGLFPYIFTSSSHLTFTLSLALPFWLSFMLYGWINNTQHMFAHLVPQGTPPILMPFMVCIETISNIIRPLTLAVRLAANMIAGHLLLTLLGNTGPMIMNSAILIQILILSQILLLILELAVSIIQSYVFAVLTTLYSSEVN
uniref:ATP synthase subunit a n=2 Tax=Teleogryllus TaxID=82804 RepID=B8QI03_9ORTH|nr:ATP synthase F0 subunit 6 [Teleogryllus emma]YP_009186319.1 ATP synthase F0 subunit 6 [Teleogryllus oceanicus]ACB12516.1 ATP synthase F0 subunit 6 [Teleogryllus emma]ALO71666.1 ATP synthase F0 subunit 6 [Teleogryllus oceanicus]ANU83233.1 ATP synthase F0 subunit 6 [Teleogryllus emma]UBU97820.1 ATP synthase F0 subunit 6 [Teleogryllus emma]